MNHDGRESSLDCEPNDGSEDGPDLCDFEERADPSMGYITCPICSGHGELETGSYEPDTGYPSTAPCPACGGEGAILDFDEGGGCYAGYPQNKIG